MQTQFNSTEATIYSPLVQALPAIQSHPVASGFTIRFITRDKKNGPVPYPIIQVGPRPGLPGKQFSFYATPFDEVYRNAVSYYIEHNPHMSYCYLMARKPKLKTIQNLMNNYSVKHDIPVMELKQK